MADVNQTAPPPVTFMNVYPSGSKQHTFTYNIINRLQKRVSEHTTEQFSVLSKYGLYDKFLAFSNSAIPDLIEYLDDTGVSEMSVSKVVGRINKWLAENLTFIDGVPDRIYPDKGYVPKEIKLHVRMLLVTFDGEYVDKE